MPSSEGRRPEAVDVGVPDSLTDDSEAEEFPLTDSVLSVESTEEAEDDAEEAGRAGGGWGEAAASAGRLWSAPSEERRDGEREEAGGGDEGEAEDEWASAEGEDEGEL